MPDRLFERIRRLKHRRKEISLRFSRWVGPTDESFEFFKYLIEPILGKPLIHEQDSQKKVDIEISSVYGTAGKSNISDKFIRRLNSKRPGGVPFGSWAHSFNLQPSRKATVNIFYTGENERPPLGDWDAYLSFDQYSFGGKNAYLPLWWITCTDIARSKPSPYLLRHLTIQSLLSKRDAIYEKRRKFCVAFIGKAYPFRMQSLNELSKIAKVEVFGSVARKSVTSKFKVAQNFRFVFCFENDLYPGYVTEKVIEAWATGAIPLYWGKDVFGYINPKAIINLADFDNFHDFVSYVEKVNKSKVLWQKIASEPILLRAPDLSQVNKVLSQALESLK
jgi:hypothetical protein